MHHPINAIFLLLVLSASTPLPGAHEAVILENSELRVRVSPLGAELQSIVSRRNGREYLWHGDPAFWANRAPVMFPIIVRFKNDAYTFRGKRYTMPPLGLAHQRQFEVRRNESGTEARFLLAANDATRTHYPFEFRFTVRFAVQQRQVLNAFTVENTGAEPLYFALGGHPGFIFVRSKQSRRSDYELIFSQPVTSDRPLIADGLWQGKRVPFLDGDTRLGFDDPRIPASGMFLENVAARVIGIGPKGQRPFVTVDLGSFPNVNLWSLAGSPFACIEPMVSHHDAVDAPEAIEARSHLIVLGPGEAKHYHFAIEIHPDAATEQTLPRSSHD